MSVIRFGPVTEAIEQALILIYEDEDHHGLSRTRAFVAATAILAFTELPDLEFFDDHHIQICDPDSSVMQWRRGGLLAALERAKIAYEALDAAEECSWDPERGNTNQTRFGHIEVRAGLSPALPAPGRLSAQTMDEWIYEPLREDLCLARTEFTAWFEDSETGQVVGEGMRSSDVEPVSLRWIAGGGRVVSEDGYAQILSSSPHDRLLHEIAFRLGIPASEPIGGG